MWTPLQKVLEKRVGSLGLGRELFLGELSQKWDEVLSRELGEAFKKRSRPTKIKNNELWVLCVSSVWANELQIREIKILNRLKQKYKNLPFGRIRFSS